jgi:hypothetical protein
LGGFLAQKSQTQPFTPHYLKYEGVKTQIFMASQTSSYDYANQTYVSNDGVTVAKGSGVFTINLALHNDYQATTHRQTRAWQLRPWMAQPTSESNRSYLIMPANSFQL